MCIIFFNLWRLTTHHASYPVSPPPFSLPGPFSFKTSIWRVSSRDKDVLQFFMKIILNFKRRDHRFIRITDGTLNVVFSRFQWNSFTITLHVVGIVIVVIEISKKRHLVFYQLFQLIYGRDRHINLYDLFKFPPINCPRLKFKEVDIDWSLGFTQVSFSI